MLPDRILKAGKHDAREIPAFMRLQGNLAMGRNSISDIPRYFAS
jgi:hypothetical protein